MKYIMLAVFLSSVLTSLSATQELSKSDECSVTFQIQVPLPIRDVPERQVALTSEQEITEYLGTLKNPNDIPTSMYGILIDKVSNNSFSEEFSNSLLRLWGMQPNDLVSGKEEVVANIGYTLLDVKNALEKK